MARPIQAVVVAAAAGQWLDPASLSLCSRLNKTLPSHRFTSMLLLSKRPSARQSTCTAQDGERKHEGGERLRQKEKEEVKGGDETGEKANPAGLLKRHKQLLKE